MLLFSINITLRAGLKVILEWHIFMEKSLLELPHMKCCITFLYAKSICWILCLYPFACLMHFCVWCSWHYLFIMQYSLFGSILTIGAMIGAIVSGKLADYIGRRGVSISITVELYLVILLSVKLQKDHQLFNFLVVLQGRQWASQRYSAWPAGLP